MKLCISLQSFCFYLLFNIFAVLQITMIESNQNIIENLKKKIELLISKYEAVVSENKILSTELSLLKSNLENEKNKGSELENKVNNLQLVEAFRASSEDVKDAKQKIAKLVKEIDKCIALLND